MFEVKNKSVKNKKINTAANVLCGSKCTAYGYLVFPTKCHATYPVSCCEILLYLPFYKHVIFVK